MTMELVNGVRNYYGPRNRYEAAQGVHKTFGATKELVIQFAGATYLEYTGSLPAGATLRDVLVEVNEVFNLGGTTPVINIGVSGTEGTNRVAQISEAQAEALGTYNIAPAGTLAVGTPLAAAAVLKVALGGTSPTITGAGQCKIVVRYDIL